MQKRIVLALCSLLITACDQPAKPISSSEAAVDAALKRIEEKNRLRDEQDKRNAPFDSKLVVEHLSTEQKMDMCGTDYRSLAVGWPIKKALVCAGREMQLVSDSAGGSRIWQHCYSTGGGCLTVGEQDGYVTTWNR